MTVNAFSCDYFRSKSVSAESRRFVTMTYNIRDGVSRQFYRPVNNILCDKKKTIILLYYGDFRSLSIGELEFILFDRFRLVHLCERVTLKYSPALRIFC